MLRLAANTNKLAAHYEGGLPLTSNFQVSHTHFSLVEANSHPEAYLQVSLRKIVISFGKEHREG